MARCLIAGLTALATAVAANPQGPQVVSGTATFTQPSANVLNVTNSHNAIINWQSFSIGQGQTTNFIQPSSASAVLNRVMGNNPSQIYGNLNSNGKVFLINQHGLMIGAGAQINTAGFFGSTLNITNEDFLNGRLNFAGGGLGGIENYGYIHAGPGGNVVLIAPDIENGGVIEVDDGNVILAAGESIRITSLNDASIEFDVQAPDNGIINLGSIVANHGAARLFAGNLEHSGDINATGIMQNADGSISLVASHDIEIAAGATLVADGENGGNIALRSREGDVYFAGTASARGEGHVGGRIEILGERVGLFGNALVDASGKSGGGEVYVGGDFQGRGSIQTATQTQVNPHAEIRADALESGDGGTVIVWADETTLFHGSATARGGATTGDGGFIEVSGKGRLDYRGYVDAAAADGAAGTILFDPRDLTIQVGGGPVPIILADNLFDFNEPSGSVDSTIDPFEIVGITNSGNNVILRANRDLLVNSDIATAASGAGGDITLEAGRSVLLNANIFTDNGALKIYANSLGASAADRGAGVAEISMAPGTSLDTGTSNIELWLGQGVAGTSGDITVNDVNAAHVLFKQNGLTAGSDILQLAGGTITAQSVFIDHNGAANGSVGTGATPLNLVTDNLAAYIWEATTNGIFIDAQPISTTVTVGNTCYGTATAPGCDTFAPPPRRGLETVNGGGDISLTVDGNLVIGPEPVRINDAQATGNPGDIFLTTTPGNSITSSNDITNDIVGGLVVLNSDTAVSLTGGTYRGTLQANPAATPDIAGTITFEKFILDTDATIVDAATLTVVDTLDILAGHTLTFASTGMNATLTTGSPTVDLNGPGTILFGGTLASNQILVGANTTLTIGPSLTLSGQGSIVATAAASALVNNGTLISDGAGLTLNTLPGAWTNNGSVIAANGTTLTLQGGALSNSGLLQVDAASTILTLNQDLDNLAGAIVQGKGTIDMNTGTLTNSGTLKPGIGINDIGTLSITGNYTQTAGGTLDIELNGVNPGNGPGFHDQLIVSGTATLDGALAVTNILGYVQAPGDVYQMLNSATLVVGTFNPLALTLPATINSPPTYGANFVNLVSNAAGAFAWTGGGDGINWDDALNWNFGVPGIGDDVVIGAFAVAAVAGGNANSLAIGSGGSLDITGGTMTVANGLTLNGSLSMQAGATLLTQDGAPLHDIATNAGSFLYNNGGVVTNLGASQFNGGFAQSGGTANFSGLVTHNGTFDLSGGTLTYTGGANLANLNNTWSGGTIAGGAPIVLAGSPGTTELTLGGVAAKTLNAVTLDLNQNDLNIFGDGDLVLAGGATVDNAFGDGINHFGNGDIVGTGTLDNTDGTINNWSGNTTISVDLVNTTNSQVNVLGGTLVIQDPETGGDPATYFTNTNAVLQVDANRVFTNTINSFGTVHVSNTATATMNLGGTFTTAGLLLSGSATLAGDPVVVQQSFLWAGGTIASASLTTNPFSAMAVTAPNVTLPAVANINGSVGLVNANLALNGNLLTLGNGSFLSGTGTVVGNVLNNAGVVVAGGFGAIGNLTINGAYIQNADSAVVIEVFNNGFSTVSDQFIVTGPATLNGGTLLIGFTTTSLGLVTGNFVPFVFGGGVSGSFGQVIDAGGNLLFLDVNGPVFTVLGVSPQIPEEILSDLLKFLESQEELGQEIANAESTAGATIDEIEQTLGDEDGDGLICI